MDTPLPEDERDEFLNRITLLSELLRLYDEHPCCMDPDLASTAREELAFLESLGALKGTVL